MAEAVMDIGSRRELFVDEYLLERMQGAGLRLQKPVPRELAIVHDAPWEGNTCAYHTVFQDGDRYRMYYRGSHYDEKAGESAHAEIVCYAESGDGIHWQKPELGLVEFGGSKKNNIVWDGPGGHNFAPFKDANPECAPGARYKALASQGDKGLWAFRSADGLRWELMGEAPVITEGKFDSQNLAFWDGVRGRYVDFHRHFYQQGGKRVRGIMTCTSKDFRQWTDPVWIDFGQTPAEQLYTNQVVSYHRAPHLFLGFPKRFVPERTVVEHAHNGVSDGVFMSSRDGVHFRRWREAFIRPGLQAERWVNRNNMTAWGLVETESFLPGTGRELSLYSTEHYYRGEAAKLRRFTLRLDGFASVSAPMEGGQVLTRPLKFAGRELRLNFSTSAAGSVRIEVQGEEGRALEGFSLAECEEIYGDAIERPVRWRGGGDVSALAGRAVRLRLVLQDADVYALQFC